MLHSCSSHPLSIKDAQHNPRSLQFNIEDETMKDDAYEVQQDQNLSQQKIISQVCCSKTVESRRTGHSYTCQSHDQVKLKDHEIEEPVTIYFKKYDQLEEGMTITILYKVNLQSEQKSNYDVIVVNEYVSGVFQISSARINSSHRKICVQFQTSDVGAIPWIIIKVDKYCKHCPLSCKPVKPKAETNWIFSFPKNINSGNSIFKQQATLIGLLSGSLGEVKIYADFKLQQLKIKYMDENTNFAISTAQEVRVLLPNTILLNYGVDILKSFGDCCLTQFTRVQYNLLKYIFDKELNFDKLNNQVYSDQFMQQMQAKDYKDRVSAQTNRNLVLFVRNKIYFLCFPSKEIRNQAFCALQLFTGQLFDVNTEIDEYKTVISNTRHYQLTSIQDDEETTDQSNYRQTNLEEKPKPVKKRIIFDSEPCERIFNLEVYQLQKRDLIVRGQKAINTKLKIENCLIGCVVSDYGVQFVDQNNNFLSNQFYLEKIIMYGIDINYCIKIEFNEKPINLLNNNLTHKFKNQQIFDHFIKINNFGDQTQISFQFNKTFDKCQIKLLAKQVRDNRQQLQYISLKSTETILMLKQKRNFKIFPSLYGFCLIYENQIHDIYGYTYSKKYTNDADGEMECSEQHSEQSINIMDDQYYYVYQLLKEQ